MHAAGASSALTCPNDEERPVSAHNGLDKRVPVQLAHPLLLLQKVCPHHLDWRLQRELKVEFAHTKHRTDTLELATPFLWHTLQFGSV